MPVVRVPGLGGETRVYYVGSGRSQHQPRTLAAGPNV
jgi:hypothetical protein